jgi:hypothetical protein
MAVLPTAKQMANNITLTVRIKRGSEWGIRLKIGAWLIRLAAWVMWMDIEIEEIEAGDWGHL